MGIICLPPELHSFCLTDNRTGPELAVIDIGSNKIRLDIYRRGPDGQEILVYTESHKPRLAEGTSKGHRILAEDRVAEAEFILSHYKEIIDGRGITHIDALATAAVRAVQHTQSGQAMLTRLENALGGHKIDILSSRAEAIWSGRGVYNRHRERLLKHPDRRRLFANTGGGSIEFGELHTDGTLLRPLAIPYGSHVCIQESDHNPAKVPNLIHRNADLAKANFGKVDELYIEGGDWRALGKVIFARLNHEQIPNVPDELVLSWKDLRHEILHIVRKEAKHHAEYQKALHERAETMPYSAMALLAVIDKFVAPDPLTGFKGGKVIFSNANIRAPRARATLEAISLEPELEIRASPSRSTLVPHVLVPRPIPQRSLVASHS
jgi:exopolyphosphatase/pppGpp-phosphohydrolase